MAIMSRCDARLGCTFVVWSGEVTPADWRAHFDALVADPAFPPGPAWLVDARRAAVDLFDDDAIARVGARMSEMSGRLGGIRLAVLPNGAWAQASVLLEYEVAVEGLVAIQFNALDTACLWLGVPIDDARAVLRELLAEAARPATGA